MIQNIGFASVSLYDSSDPLVRQTSNIEFFVVNIGNHSLFLLINRFSQTDFQVQNWKPQGLFE